MNTRKEYGLLQLTRAELATDPFEQFTTWYLEAELKIPEANAMTLATADNEQPSQRIVLLKSYDANGFVFYSNYLSRKGLELAKNPKASLLFWWQSLERQVRIEGQVYKTTTEQSDRYFSQRDREAQISALASKQSQAIPSKKFLNEEVEVLKQKYASINKIPRPAEWGGYRLEAAYFEFWQGGKNRLHDRFSYLKNTDDTWKIQRISP